MLTNTIPVLLIYTTVVSKRLQYIITTLFGDVARLTTDPDEFIAHDGAKINYSNSLFSTFTITPHPLLFEKGIHQQAIECFEWEQETVFFRINNGDIPFDIFAASFYLITRYEEYLPCQPDEYGRFPHEAGVACQQGFLHTPLVQYWVRKLLEKLQIAIPLNNRSFLFTPSYDIDVAYCYQEQPLIKNLYGFFKSLLQGKFEAFLERANVFSGMQPDPYDQYDWLDKIHQALHLKPVYFFLLAKKRKGVDKNIHPSRKLFQELILQHAKKYTVGIHPSWQSGNNETLLLEEISNLEKIINSSNAHSSNTQTSVSLTSDAQLANTDSSIIHSRQHYLRMSLPETYQRLIRAGIKKDYTMGYGRTNGFRASYAVPHCWFDLSKDVITDLEIHPFCFMDTTAIFQNRSAVYDAFLELQELYDQVKFLGGEMVCIFHNQYLTNQPECIEWKNGYEIFLRKNSVTTQEK